MVGRTTLSGIQRKISIDLAVERGALRLVLGAGHFILKPQAQTFPEIPQNELLTTRMAEHVGIDVPPCGLVRLRDNTLAYIVRRFDRLQDKRKLRQEDFCQLAEKPPKDKYEGSGELCVRLLRRYASEPLVDVLRLYRLMVFSWWTGNGDMHLKNFSLLTGDDDLHRLSPAYDLICTRLVIPGDQLALSVGGKCEHLTREDWLAFAKYGGVPDRSAQRILATIVSSLDACLQMIDRSFLSSAFTDAYRDLLRERAAVLAA
ncbi:MAG: HipA domain-containing protein [Acidobacteria bacterium]|nr:HipA domain-containing protein [Acidobacteriota bacterium]